VLKRRGSYDIIKKTELYREITVIRIELYAFTPRIFDCRREINMKILFVCHGNICRSPMAEFIFKDILRKCGRYDDFTVESRATSSEELGNPIYPPARAELEKHGISYGKHAAVRITPADYGRYDMIIGMDARNLTNMNRIFGGDPENKIFKLMDFTERGGDVSDPYYFGGFDKTFRDIYDGCKALSKRIYDSYKVEK